VVAVRLNPLDIAAIAEAVASRLHSRQSSPPNRRPAFKETDATK